MSQQINMQQLPFKSIASFAIIGLFIILLQSAFVIVDAGHVGVIKRLGAVQAQHLNEGFHLKIPVIDDVIQLDIRLRKVSNDPISASKDLQTVRTEVSVQYSLNGDIAPTSFQKIGIRQVIESTLIEPAIQESVKLGIPIIAILDSNSNPDGIDFPIPGNDDARRSIDLYCNLIKETIVAAKKTAPSIDNKKTEEKKDEINKTKTVAEIDRDKLDKKFSKKKEKKAN